jgi:hypothetical protein
MKNAPSRAVPSKEAALHGRESLVFQHEVKDSDSNISNTPRSIDSSGSSSSELTSDDDDDQSVSVEILPSSVGRGKQLRFPVVSQVKEPISVGEGAGSDSESYASIDSEDDEERQGVDHGKEEILKNIPSQVDSANHMVKKGEKLNCPINSTRARKRYRPESSYVKQMSTYIRDCLLTVRDGGESTDAQKESSHREFRNKLRKGEVERIKWNGDDSTEIKKKLGKDENKQHDEQKRMKVAAINGRSKNETSTPQKDNNIDIKLKQSKGDQTNYCSKCKKGINHFETNEEITENHQKSSFTIQSNQSGDVQKLRAEATMLNEEARALKHEGNRKGASENGAKGQLAQAHYYLKSSAKFLQHALKLADVKVAYKEIGDSQHARTYGDYSVTTLAQTSSLIESTMRTFQNARNVKLLALSCKFSAVVHLAIYRFQHISFFLCIQIYFHLIAHQIVDPMEHLP